MEVAIASESLPQFLHCISAAERFERLTCKFPDANPLAPYTQPMGCDVVLNLPLDVIRVRDLPEQ